MSFDLLSESRFGISRFSAFDVLGSDLLLNTGNPIATEGFHGGSQFEKAKVSLRELNR
jgi:hypothetical protein